MADGVFFQALLKIFRLVPKAIPIFVKTFSHPQHEFPSVNTFWGKRGNV